jgi:hypothetical protein
VFSHVYISPALRGRARWDPLEVIRQIEEGLDVLARRVAVRRARVRAATAEKAGRL